MNIFSQNSSDLLKIASQSLSNSASNVSNIKIEVGGTTNKKGSGALQDSFQKSTEANELLKKEFCSILGKAVKAKGGDMFSLIGSLRSVLKSDEVQESPTLKNILELLIKFLLLLIKLSQGIAPNKSDMKFLKTLYKEMYGEDMPDKLIEKEIQNLIKSFWKKALPAKQAGTKAGVNKELKEIFAELHLLFEAANTE